MSVEPHLHLTPTILVCRAGDAVGTGAVERQLRLAVSGGGLADLAPFLAAFRYRAPDLVPLTPAPGYGTLAGAAEAFRQLFIISHVDDVQASPILTEIWRVVETADGVSRIERVSHASGLEEL